MRNRTLLRYLLLVALYIGAGCGKHFDVLYINYDSKPITVYFADTRTGGLTVPARGKALIVAVVDPSSSVEQYDTAVYSTGKSKRIDYSKYLEGKDGVYNDSLIIVELQPIE